MDVANGGRLVKVSVSVMVRVQAVDDPPTAGANSAPPGYGDIELSYVFCLTEGQSSMQIAGYEVFQYGGAGQGAVFNAAFWHASVHAEPGTVKVAVFLNKKS